MTRATNDSRKGRFIKSAKRPKVDTKRRRLEAEMLEIRRVLAGQPTPLASIEELAASLEPHRPSIEGVTVVTHGFQFTDGDGDSMQGLGSAIQARTDYENGSAFSSWLLDYDVRDEGSIGGFDLDLSASDDEAGNGSIMSGVPSEIVILFDWARGVE